MKNYLLFPTPSVKKISKWWRLEGALGWFRNSSGTNQSATGQQFNIVRYYSVRNKYFSYFLDFCGCSIHKIFGTLIFTISTYNFFSNKNLVLKYIIILHIGIYNKYNFLPFHNKLWFLDFFCLSTLHFHLAFVKSVFSSVWKFTIIIYI